MNADDFRVSVFHSDEDIGSAFPDGDRLRHVYSPHFIDLVTLSVMIVPSWGLVSVRPTRCGASRPFSRITRRTRRGLVRTPAKRNRAHNLR
jgi:hypothetical protein